MIIDVNTYIGHWPFRQLRHNNAKSLLKYLENGKIDRACVSSINAVFYKDCMEANRELIDEIKPYKDKLIPFCIINPKYNNWKEDFIECIEGLGFKGLELYPYYHDYKLYEDEALELIELAIKYNILIHLPCAIANIRQRHNMDTLENLDIKQVKNVLEKFSEGNFIISNGTSNEIAKELIDISKLRAGKVYYDFTRIEVFTDAINELIDIVSVDNVIVGSVAPFQYIEPQIVKLNYIKLSEKEKEKIEHKNILNLL